MANHTTDFHAALGVFQGCLLVSVQADLYDDLLVAIREQTLQKVYAKTVKGVIFDMSAVRVMDTFVFNHLADTGKMAMVLGVETVFAGFQPGAVSALVDLSADTADINSFRSCEEALAYLTARFSSGVESANRSEQEDHHEDESDEYASVTAYA
jgi:anti-anti-sigma regulatory factor